MHLSMKVVAASCLSLALWASGAGAEAITADHVAVTQFDLIPDSVIQQIQTGYRFFYGHTSHGSQIMTGLGLLSAEDPLYAVPSFYEYGSDLGHLGDTTWVQPTRTYLDSHPACNVVMWSWCGGCSDNTEEGINIYLNAMNRLELDYPGVTFIYMTGHLDGTGPGGNLYARNNQIREYCASHDKVLFDFADIESWDPAGVYYPYESDACGWCGIWCSSHPCPSCDCAHSHCFNCYQKGKGFWWMMARVAGWLATAVEPAGDIVVPGPFGLEQNWPNPFRPPTVIGFRTPAASAVTLEIFTVTGKKVVTLVEGRVEAGPHAVSWDGKDANGRRVSAGNYFCRLRAGAFTATRKMTVLE